MKNKSNKEYGCFKVVIDTSKWSFSTFAGAGLCLQETVVDRGLKWGDGVRGSWEDVVGVGKALSADSSHALFKIMV